MARTLPGTRPGGRKYRASKWVTTKLVNPSVRALIERGLFPSAWCLLETTGRRSGQPRRTPVGNGKRGDVFWIVTEHGHHADYVKNIKADPRVRVKVGRRWYSGTAHILEDDDPYARLRKLRRPVNDSMLLAVGTQQLTIRIDLDDAQPAGATP
jgi:deazaflavin-dependent oxidoreductase (nitroreductase family)